MIQIKFILTYIPLVRESPAEFSSVLIGSAAPPLDEQFQTPFPDASACAVCRPPSSRTGTPTLSGDIGNKFIFEVIVALA